MGNKNTALKTLDNGAVVPVDEPAVASARAKHLASKNAAPGNTQLVSHPNGAVVPADDQAVVAARAAHLASKAAAASASGSSLGYASAASASGSSLGYAGAASASGSSLGYAGATPAVGSSLGYAAAAQAGYGSSSGLVTHSNGAVVPAYEPAVAAARAKHLNAF